MGDVDHQLRPGRKSSCCDKEEVRRDRTNCTKQKGMPVLQQELTGSVLVTCFGAPDGNAK